MIDINSVYKYVEDSKEEKIRIIDIIDDYTYIVSINGVTSMPRKELLATILQDINAEKLILTKDPYSRIIDETSLSELQISKRDFDWQVILKFWNEDKMELLEKKYRNKIFKEISEQVGISVPKIGRAHV